MSLTYTLRRWADPDFDTSSEYAEQQRLLEQAPAPIAGDGMDTKIFHLVLQRSHLRCRICGLKSEGSRFCLTCLADTME